LPEIDRKNASEFELTVLCAWRFSQNRKIMCTWRDASNNATWMKLDKLVGRRIKSATVHSQFFDLAIEFEGGFLFEVFCDLASIEEDDNNYIFSDESLVASVDVNFELTKPQTRVGILSS